MRSYCAALPNSFGAAGAIIGMSGSTSISADDFTLRVRGAASGQVGKFYYGPLEAEVPFGDGLRCVGGATYRLYPLGVVDPQGELSRQVDFDAPPAGSGPGAITPGSTWHFQFWFRDPHGPGGTGHNLSNGLSVLFDA